MARLARLVIPGCAHYVVHCARDGVELYSGAPDYQFYLDLLNSCCARNVVAIRAWCLQPDGISLVLTPATHEGLARAVGETHRLFARHRGLGSAALWRGRYQSCPLDPKLALSCIAHVETAAPGSAWPWASTYGLQPAPESEIATIRAAIRAGRPAGSPEFIARIEYETGRRLGSRRRGRPRKW